MGYYGGWPKYVTVAERRAKAEKHVQMARKKGVALNPIVTAGNQIAKTFWGKAWCNNLEIYSDYANRLPRGRTYLRNGSVIDLQVTKGRVDAQVMGSSLYRVTIQVRPLPETRWKSLVSACSGKIDSLVELLQGKFSHGVMTVIVDKDKGLFPAPREISMSCSCPDDAGLCKHLAAVLYGVGTSLDHQPEWLFLLRHVDHLELLSSANTNNLFKQEKAGGDTIQDSELSALFGIDIEESKVASASEAPKPKKAGKRSKPRVPKRKKETSK